MAAKACLDDYPALRRWYLEHRDAVLVAAGERLVLGTCEALVKPSRMAVSTWTEKFQAFLSTSDAPHQDFLAAENLMQRCDSNLLDVIGDLGETAVRAGEPQDFLRAMQEGARGTGLVVFRFLAAWTALNSGDPQLCVHECEAVTEPFAAVHTLQGQALLELGRAQEAVEVLEVATTLGPQEILAWFQKAKALHVLDRQPEALTSLRACQRLAPQSEEVALYMALIAAETTEEGAWRESWAALRPKMSRVSGVGLVTLVLVRLAALLDDKAKALEVLGESTWNGDMTAHEIGQHLTGILRHLGAKDWMDIASRLLAKVKVAPVGS